MYNPEYRQYVLKNSLGISYHVYFEEGRGLCIRMLSDSRIWSRGYILDKTAINDFSVVLDKNDIFHFFYQARDGSLMYGHGMHGQIESRPVLNSREPTPWPKYVSLLVIEKTAIFFYVLKHQNRHIISMQSVRDGKLSRPTAIDYTDNTRYCSFVDMNGKCHLFYVTSDNIKSHLIHRILNDDFTAFSAAEKVFSTDGKINFLSAVCSETNKIHVIAETYGNDMYEILYRNLSDAGRPETLYRSLTAPGYSGLVYNSGTIFFFRTVNEDIYFRSSDNDGASWSDEAMYPLGSNIVCFSYISNMKDENVFPGEIPGNFTRGYQLAFFSEEKIKSVHERKTSSGTENDFLLSLEKKILQLQNQADTLQKEFTKLWLTQKNVERRLEYLSRLYDDIQDIVNYPPADESNEKPPQEPFENTPEIPQTGGITHEEA